MQSHDIADNTNSNYQPHLDDAPKSSQTNHQHHYGKENEADYDAAATKVAAVNTPSTHNPYVRLQLLTKIVKAACFLIMTICASSALSAPESLRWSTGPIDPPGCIAAAVLGLVLEGVTLVLLVAGALSKLTNNKPTVVMLVINIISMIFYFISIVVLTRYTAAPSSTGYNAFAAVGLTVGGVELHKQISTLRGRASHNT